MQEQSSNYFGFLCYMLTMSGKPQTPVQNIAVSQGLTAKRVEFVANIVIRGMTQTAAAEAAGYAVPGVAASVLMRQPQVLEAIRLARLAAVDADLAGVAFDTLKEVMQNPKAPASARVTAATRVLTIGGYIERGKTLGKEGEGGKKDLADMTPGELKQHIADMRRQLDEADDEATDLAADMAQPVEKIEQIE
jgi:phage terminase small subunit